MQGDRWTNRLPLADRALDRRVARASDPAGEPRPGGCGKRLTQQRACRLRPFAEVGEERPTARVKGSLGLTRRC